ncbi:MULTISPECIES: hypothetical protein [Serratia]|uniref:hypothetical protein n=1 Tax=Serratia TaxID=613 RepID=UPI0011DC38AD|nr:MULTISPECIES: hypothetical protein [Serratia]TXE64828.1 hypothetical protein FOT58_10860 [Serratia nematodiphila]UYU05092.1 hypothetical protein OHY99_05470 [Serratia marcescens]BEM10512.1 hypothetical protein SM14VA5_30160 [Serratia marcescens]
MKKIILGIIAIVVVLFLYGVYKAKSQLSDGVSLFEIGVTYQSMNPVSQYGYQWVMRNDSDVLSAVKKMNESYEKLKSE